MINLQSDILDQVIAQAKLSAGTDRRWVSAIDRAAHEFETNPYLEALDDHTLLIGSPSGNTYIGNGSCQCESFRRALPCWHRAAARLYRRYVEMEARQAARPAVDLHRKIAAARATAAINELF